MHLAFLFLLFFLFVMFFLFFFHSLSSFDGFLNFHQSFFCADLPFFHLVNDVADIFKDFNILNVGFSELNRLDDFCNFHDRGFVTSGIFQQLVQPGFLQTQPDGEDHIRIRDGGDILCARLVCMRISADR